MPDLDEPILWIKPRTFGHTAVGFAILLAMIVSPVAAFDVPYTNSPLSIDGLLGDSAWNNATSLTYPGGGDNGPVTVKMLWDQDNFYLGYSATDQYLWNDGTDVEVWNDDSVDFNIDIHHDGGASLGPDNVELDIDIGGELRTLGGTQYWDPDDVIERQVALLGTVNDNSDIDTGYTIEVKVPWTELITPYSGRSLGITFGNSDDDDGGPRDPGGYNLVPGTNPFVPDTFLDMTLTGGPNTPVPMFSNPVLQVKNYNLADPAVAFHSGRYYTVQSTFEHQHNQIIMYSSPNLVDWDFEGVVYETPGTPGSWNEGFIFAPDLFIDNGDFYIGYSASPNGSATGRRIGLTHSTSINGTYTDLTSGPLFDPGENTLDQRIEKVGNDYYIYWSQYDNNRGIVGAKLNSTLTGLATTPQVMFTQGAGEALIEAPWTYQRDGTIYMFYSANSFDDENYRVGYATSTSPLGPFTKQGHILVKNSAVKGPGHNSVVDSPDGKETFIVYHTWETDPFDGFRQLAIDRLYFRDDGSVFTFGPTTDDHPLPSGTSGSFGVLPIGNPGFETGDLSDWVASSTAGSTNHIFVESNFDPAQVQEGQQHAAIWNAGTSKQGNLSQVLTDLEGGATYRVTGYTRSSGRTVDFGVTTEAGHQVSLNADHANFTREEFDFLVPHGSTQATLWFDSPAGGDGSWVWIDAVEVFKIRDDQALQDDAFTQGLWHMDLVENTNPGGGATNFIADDRTYGAPDRPDGRWLQLGAPGVSSHPTLLPAGGPDGSGALDFDGINDYATASGVWENSSPAIAIDFQMKADSLPDLNGDNFMGLVGVLPFQLYLQDDGNGMGQLIALAFHDTQVGGFTVLSSQSGLELDQWHDVHAEVTADGGFGWGILSLIVDGQPFLTAMTQPLGSQTSQAVLGRQVTSLARYFDGALDEVRISAPPFPHPGDFNGDGVVDGIDFAKWQLDFGNNAGSDADHDSDSDGTDFLAWQRNFGQGSVLASSSSVSVPEPSTLALMIAGLLFTSIRPKKLIKPGP